MRITLTKLLAPLVTLAATAALLIAPTTAGAANSFGADAFGISVGGALQNEDSTTLARDLDAIGAAGSRWVRVDINWAQVQAGGPTTYNWSAIDRVVQGAAAHGMKVLGVIDYTPSWARPSGTSATYGPDPAKYAAFAKTAAAHYGALGVHAYEVWNEPNITAFWTDKPDPAAYTRLLKAAYPAIKAGDPQATVLTGGTSPAGTDGTNYSPVDFLKGIYANGGAGYFDAVANHPYCWPANPGDAQSWSAWYQMYGTSTSQRSLMTANGDGAKKIWATEFGAPTNGPSGSYVSEDTQAQMLSKAMALWATYDWGGPMFVHQGRDLGTSTSTRENFFGLLRNDWSEKPAYAAFRAAATGTTVPTTDPAPTDPPPTTTTVKGAGKGKGKGNVKGSVETKTASGKSASAVADGRIEVRLYLKGRRHWRAASGWQHTKLVRSGRFKARLRHLHAGTYRVDARYLGSPAAKPSAGRSRAFRVRR